ncbi:MAG: FAD:protein transferase [Solirubrobacteraceae bacterium]|nr:FAD:protein transferase [Solirubrobacteraceae bacterium]
MSPPREASRRVACFGGRVEVLVGGSSPSGTAEQLAALLAQGRLRSLHGRLSRFEPSSELSLLNADPHEVVHASRLLRRLARAVVEAGERTGGLVDATLVGAIERAGYATSRAGLPGLAAAELMARTRPPRPARPHPDRAWRRIVVDDGARTITRPPGLRIDSGGLGKGLAADLVAGTLATHPAFAVDCAGDVRIGGSARVARRVLVEHPFGGAPVHELSIVDGAVATSGVSRRSWRDAGGAAAHHLLDPATGAPAWTGVLQATALAPTALEAETLAKAALLAGPQEGRELLVHGGVLVLDDASVHVVRREPAVRAA